MPLPKFIGMPMMMHSLTPENKESTLVKTISCKYNWQHYSGNCTQASSNAMRMKIPQYRSEALLLSPCKRIWQVVARNGYILDKSLIILFSKFNDTKVTHTINGICFPVVRSIEKMVGCFLKLKQKQIWIIINKISSDHLRWRMQQEVNPPRQDE